MLSEKANRWNRFIDEICSRSIDSLSMVQKNAVLCFLYDTEMCSGGHSGFFDCYPDIASDELYAAISAVSCESIANNFLRAVENGSEDDWEETDNAYYSFSPSLSDDLQKFVEEHRNEIFS